MNFTRPGATNERSVGTRPMRYLIFAAENPVAGRARPGSALPGHKTMHVLGTLAMMGLISPAVASDWQYGCKGVLPNRDAPVNIFNRS